MACFRVNGVSCNHQLSAASSILVQLRGMRHSVSLILFLGILGHLLCSLSCLPPVNFALGKIGMSDGYAEASSEPIRLTYFAGYGLAEQVRWMMAASEITFEQVALQSHEEFLQLRRDGKLLFGQLPLLEIDGLRLVQSQAMVRYVAQRGKLCGTTLAESALVDMVAEGIKDARGLVVSFPFVGPGEQANLIADIPQRTAKQLQPLEALIQSRENGTVGFLATGLSAADVLLAELAEELLEMRSDALALYPKITKLHKQVTDLPQMQRYLKSPARYPFPKGNVGLVYVQNVDTVLNRRR